MSFSPDVFSPRSFDSLYYWYSNIAGSWYVASIFIAMIFKNIVSLVKKFIFVVKREYIYLGLFNSIIWEEKLNFVRLFHYQFLMLIMFFV